MVARRKVVYSCGVSLDGYIARPDGSYEWLERATRRAKGEDFGMDDFFDSIDTVIMGRKTYAVGLKHGMAKEGFPGKRNIVFSRRLRPGVRHGVEFVAGSPRTLISRLRRRPGKDIWLCGGGELAREFLREGVVDEVGIGVVPLLLGAGRPMFPPRFDEVELALAECKRYKGDVVVLTYRVHPWRRPRRRSGRPEGTRRR